MPRSAPGGKRPVTSGSRLGSCTQRHIQTSVYTTITAMIRTTVLLTLAASALGAQLTPATPLTRTAASASISNIRYEVAFTRASAEQRLARVTMRFVPDARSSEPVLLSLPAWTPGAYEISNFARSVSGFSATANGRELAWDKADPDTWRIRRAPSSGGEMTVAFDYRADTLDNAMSWARPDFLLFNGTNVFLYPEGRGLDFAAQVTVRTESDWRVVTSMTRSPSGAYSATNYHDLVDMPFFVGRFDVDSAMVSGKWMRFATYPAGSIQGEARRIAWDQLRKATPPLVAVFGEVPWNTYSVLQIVDSSFQGASGLEHSDSHVDIFSPPYLGSDFQPSLYAHEIFHAWNVKRLRPADMWPYRYDQQMPSPWLWVSEGITDYYADLALVRSGLIPDTGFYALTTGKIAETDAAGSIALEDASLSTWVHPTDGTQYIYYPKGSLAGMMLDIMIRDASDNRQSLDDVLRSLYASTYKQGRGFTRDEWWAAVSRAANGRSFEEFERDYIDGRAPFPLDRLLPLAGMRTTVIMAPRLGITTTQDERGILIASVDTGSAAGAAGVRAGDYLLAINDLAVSDQSFGPRFRELFANARDGQPIRISVQRGAQTLALNAVIRMVPSGFSVSADPAATAKALRIRNGILRGATDR
jgi:predicted metalloprotease with PDZ domain